MSKLVRATLPNGASTTVSEAYAKRKGLKYRTEGATDAHGRIRPATPHTDKAGNPTPPVKGDEKKEGGK